MIDTNNQQNSGVSEGTGATGGSGSPTQRERRVARSRWVDVGLGLLGVLFMVLADLLGLEFQRAYALLWVYVAAVFTPLAIYQYRVMDEFTRLRWLQSFAVSTLTLFTGLMLLLAWTYWTGSALHPNHLLGLFLLGWVSSWVAWFWFQHRDSRG